MKYVVDVNGTRIEVLLDGDEAVIDGLRHRVKLDTIPGTPVRLMRVGEQVHRLVARRGERRGLWRLDLDGVRYEAEALNERMRALRDLADASAVASGPAPIIAPMPGMVVRISVAVGDTVEAGQGVAVVEAMKMENELRAAAAGIVTAVRANTGQVVEKGAILVELASVPTE